jgi:phytoene desaturase
MPDVFEQYFGHFGKRVADYYDLIRLDPSYQVIFGENDTVDIPASMAELRQLFESLEPGSAVRLDAFLAQAKYKYEVGINKFVHLPSRSVLEFIDFDIVKGALRLDLLQSMAKHARKFFSHPKLLKLIEFPVLFLGATPENTPALYSLMNYADLALGTWYAEELGVKIEYDQEVQEIVVENGRSTGVRTASGFWPADAVVAGADYHHIEQQVLAPEYRHYSPAYWDSRTMAPSSLLFYLGVNRKLANLQHHNLFFDEDFSQHAHEIYEAPQWPSRPLFYASVPSKTDATVAPEGQENLFLLIPVAPDLEDPEATREKYYNLLMDRLEKHCGHPIRDAVVFKRSYAHHDFITDYHSFKGNAYGLANTLKQTAILKPSLKSTKVSNLYFTGQLTVPGPGVPPSLISGQVVAKEVLKEIKS